MISVGGLRCSLSFCRIRALHNGTILNKVPKEPTWKSIDPKDLPQETVIDKKTVELIERLALVDFSTETGIERLSRAVRYADQLSLVDTEGVRPMDTVLENRALYLRKDEVTEGNCRHDIMKNATKTYEEYFVAPPGNIPLKSKQKTASEDKDS